MPRALADNTQLILWWLWRLPWACAADIALITGLQQQAVSTALSRGRTRGWLISARLGRTSDAVDRFVFSTAGVLEFHERYAWPIFWWHTADGVRSLARRLEVLEMAYKYLPVLWRSNLVVEPVCYVYRERQDVAWQTGQPVTRVELQEADWSQGRLVDFHWRDRGSIEAIATYGDGRLNDDLLHLPILWRGNFQKPGDIASVRRDMQQVLAQDERWYRLPERQSFSPDYCPGLMIFCPDRVSAAMVQRNWRESPMKDNLTRPAIIDAQGQVIRAMSPPTAWWTGFYLPRAGAPLKNVAQAVKGLTSGPYAAVNGLPSWRLFRSIDGSPGVTLKQIAKSVGVAPGVAAKLLEAMTKRKAGDKRKTDPAQVKGRVIIVKGDGHYLDASGRGLLAYSQRVTPARVLKRWGIYARRGGEYRRGQRLHNQGQAGAILYLRGYGYAAFPTMGLVIDYWHQGKLIRVTPDAFVVLAPGVLVAIEFERTATSQADMMEKAWNYSELARIGCPIPVLFITETVDAAVNLARLRYPYVLATTLDAVRDGPHGRAVIQDEAMAREPGCWWYWYSDRDAPTPDAPIDLWSTLYAQRDENVAWRLPLDRPFARIKIEP